MRIATTHGTILIEAGRTVVAGAEDEIVFQAGQHPFEAYSGEAGGPHCSHSATPSPDISIRRRNTSHKEST